MWRWWIGHKDHSLCLANKSVMSSLEIAKNDRSHRHNRNNQMPFCLPASTAYPARKLLCYQEELRPVAGRIGFTDKLSVIAGWEPLRWDPMQVYSLIIPFLRIFFHFDQRLPCERLNKLKGKRERSGKNLRSCMRPLIWLRSDGRMRNRSCLLEWVNTNSYTCDRRAQQIDCAACRERDCETQQLTQWHTEVNRVFSLDPFSRGFDDGQSTCMADGFR